MKQRILQTLLIILAILIGLYPSIYFLIDRKFGLLSSKPESLLLDTSWNIGFYTHIILDGVALLTGWSQFLPNFRNKNFKLHRQIGFIYFISVLTSSLAGIYIGWFATGGLISVAGFICLGIVWFTSTLKAFVAIKQKDIGQHQVFMIYSYAATFAAVTLRIWLQLLTFAFNDFYTAYPIVAWLCWVPNLVVAWIIVGNLNVQTNSLN